jgi:chromosome segregation ATPase
MTTTVLNSIVAAAVITVSGTIIVALIRVHENWRNRIAEAEEKRAVAERERAEARKAEMAAMQMLNDESLGLLDPLQQRIANLEEQADKFKEHISTLEEENRQLSNRVSSVMEDAATYARALQYLEIQHEELQASSKLTRDQLVSLERDHEELTEKYKKLKDQVNHSSSPSLGIGD